VFEGVIVESESLTRYPVTVDGDTAWIGTAGELATALDVLHGREDRTILEQLQPHLAAIIGGPAPFIAVMRSLDVGDQLFLVEAVGHSLAGLIGEARHLRDLLAILAEPRVKNRLIEVLGPAGLRTLIATPRDLAGVLGWLYGESDRLVLDALGPDVLRRILRNGDELAVVLCALDADGQSRVIEAFGWHCVAEMVHDGRDLACLMRALPAALSVSLVDRFSREQLIELIRNPSDWAYLYDRLESAEAAHLLERLGAK
jgi:hypothetical protein